MDRKEIPKTENKMGTMPVPKLLISMSLPMMISMLVQALYNIVDSMFVARLNENALTAVSLAFPVQNLMISVFSGTGVGINALLSRSLGEKNTEKANSVADHGVILAGISYIAFLAFGLLFANSFYTIQTADTQIIEYGRDYLLICCVFSFGMAFQMTFERLLQSTGKTIYTMVTQGTGAIINIILDPIMIFGLFGFPKMGVSGAAAATVTGQMVAAVMAYWFNREKNREIHVSLKGFSWSGHTVRGIYSVGIPSIIMMSIGSVMTFGMNKILIAFTSTAAAVFGVYFKIQSFIFMPVFGMNNGLVPIIAYNYGARKGKRIKQAIFSGIVCAMVIMVAGFSVFQLYTGGLLAIFNASDNMMEIGVPALRIISISFLLAGFCIICSSVFQAMSHGFLSLIVSIVRQLLVLLPSAYILAKIGGLSAIWWSFPIAELFSFGLSVLFLRRVVKRQVNTLEEKIPESN
ncbi:MATE family efflux transporter [Clostridium sp. AM58-1XD]|uniref:MATE family efflux transporter n=1 Tax=Clostridium sp. AM58-1XD TaxID=2292307 RepID=UPI000E529B41|nr:MATE family efflux transporter [Clostridium sp. AM58-1XD]RGY99657.1 MATE family efflux transporter [Clostridium sp. AM58-1XD]